MKHWSEYNGHESDLKGKDNKIDNTIYTFDIETSSYLIYENQILPATDYLNLDHDQQEDCKKYACMYIWQFGINDQVYYGRTWHEFKLFLDRLEENTPERKIVFVHNLSFEFQFLRSQFHISNIMSRKSRKLIRCTMANYNIVLQCSLMMSNVSLKALPEIYHLNVQKMVGDLDYSKIRTPETPLTEKEMGYCEADCLVVYEYIKVELQTYKQVNKIPPTSTGKVRKELQNLVLKDPKYRSKVNKCINTRPSVYNMMIKAFAGGYTHANYIYTDEVIKDVDSYDETSAYPYVLVSHRFPMSEFTSCNIKKAEDMLNNLAYLVRVKFKYLKCKYYNNFISMSKCNNIINGRYDNGRIISAKEIEICLTDVDFRFILDTYEYESYEILESYSAIYDYLPIQFINFILDKYVAKTQLKGVEGRELEYQKEKNKFNALYGMTVTNMIRDDVSYNDQSGWNESELTNEDIFDKLLEEKKKSFLSFAWGVWVTAYARDNLLRRVIDLDLYTVYCDTDSCKLRPGYNKEIFDSYNQSVIDKIKKVSKILNIPFERFAPKDIKGREHILGLFEYEGKYDKFITQGAKKYCVEVDGKIKITVSGVPKGNGKDKTGGEGCLRRIEDFRDDLVFDFEHTNKLTLMYNDDQMPIDLIDYKGLKYKVKDKTGCCLLPTTYKLGKSYDYATLLNNESSKRALFK